MSDWLKLSASNSCSHRPSAFAEAVEKLSNYSLVWDNNTAYFRSYICMSIQYEEVKETWESTEAQLVFVLGIFGLIGALLSTVTLFRRPFVPADVYLYRIVGMVETVHMLVMTLIHGLSMYVDCASYLACTLFSAHVYMTLTNGCADAVEFVVVFLCVERTVACLTPQHFHRIHGLSTYRIVATLSLFFSLPFNIVHSFDVHVEQEDPQEGGKVQKYHERPSYFASTWIYARIMDAQMVRFCIVAPLIILSTTGSVIGLNKAARRKQRLRGDFRKISSLTEGGGGGGGGRKQETRKMSQLEIRSRKEIKQMIELCCLQLCLAVPVVINYLLCLVERICKIGLIERNKLWDEPFRTMTYDQAKSIIIRATMLEYLRFSISVTHMLAHGLHFYLYLSFSSKFRHTFRRWLMGCAISGRPGTSLVTTGGGAPSTGYERVKTTGGGGGTNCYELTVTRPYSISKGTR